MADVEKYLDLITAFHRGKPKFSAMVEAVSQCFVGAQDSFGQMAPAYDLDDAVGVQLDAVGEWVGISRNVRTPLEGVYFSFDVAGLGFEQGVWQGPFDPDTGVTSLDDETYRVLIRAKIGANHWDGTLESSAAILNSIFSAGTSPIPVNANAELFGTGDGATTQFQLKYQGRPVFQVGSSTIFRNDWQGNQRLYPTSRTNSFRSSIDLSNTTYWPRTRLTSVSPTTAPDGTSRAYTMTADAAGSGYSYQSYSVVTGQKYEISVFAKAGSSNVAYFQDFTQSGTAQFLLSGTGTVTGATGTMSAARIEALADGWYRCFAVLTPTATGSVNITASVVRNALASVVYFGPQIGALPTGSQGASSFIETAALPVTVTDYAASATGLITMGQVPAIGAALTWTGNGQIYPAGTYVFIQDNGDMSIDIGIAGDRPSAVFLALLTGGYIPIKPEGVRVNYYIVPNAEGPLFGFDVGNQYISGFDVGVWGDLIQP
ncbi:DUF2612 domain-containing protein [Achromobacter piechaudii]|uniref:DUF2612 domain-containing protein n=1 Tax=Achromobacter piechaudii TaxID=72556 RepID=UPI0014650133|nr:hypothetical protein LMG6103_03518 [Achromobacter piechaudii]